MGAQRRHEMVHEHDIAGVIETLTGLQHVLLFEHIFYPLMALLREIYLFRLFVDAEVTRTILHFLSLQVRNEPIDAHIQIGVLIRRARDDERCTRFVDENRVHFVDDCIVQTALGTFRGHERHVVAQVVESVFVVGSVDDIGRVGLLLFLGEHTRHDNAGTHAQKFVDVAHPPRVASRQIVVHGHDVHAVPVQGVQVGGQRGDQGLTLAGAHLRDMTLVQRNAADDLNVEVAHIEGAPGGLTHRGEGLGQQLLQGLTGGAAFAEFVSPGPELGIRELLDLGLEDVDALGRLAHASNLPFVAAADDFPDYIRDHAFARAEEWQTPRLFRLRGVMMSTRMRLSRNPPAG